MQALQRKNNQPVKKSFLQDIRDLLEKEVRFLATQNKQRAAKNRNTMRQSTTINTQSAHRAPEFGGSLLSQPSADGRNTSIAGFASRSMVNDASLTENLTIAQQQQLKNNLIGATATKRFFTKQRINETMVRELISWLGILSSSNECIH